MTMTFNFNKKDGWFFIFVLIAIFQKLIEQQLFSAKYRSGVWGVSNKINKEWIWTHKPKPQSEKN